MNDTRRKQLTELIEQLEGIKSSLDELCDEEDEAMQNTPENLQGSDRYQTAENAFNCILYAVSEIDSVIIDLESARDG